ncbi:hypothetical protein B296_00024402 [Ensete ventricosum]|uniref:Uncharacterized protein n=1 Tax=Ensete ventricosum TaxID=4639 RepID=A0A426Y337_ENSVE|nr:hypothetical protein B296_00024402 [Ensete ventricosum]
MLPLSEDRGHPALARPSTRVAGHGQAPCRGGQPRPGHLQGGNRLWPRPPVKGRPTAAKVPCKGATRCYQGQSAGAATCSATPARAASYRAPARSDR